MKRTTLLVAFMLLATAAFAHQDRILSVRVDGAIPELPPAYQTTRLHVAFSEGDAGALQQLNFLSSGRETSVKPCLLRLVPKGSFHQLFLTGSWYHDESLLPHYLQVQFRDSPSLEGLPDSPGVRFLFSLRDARLLEVTQAVPIPAERAVHLQNIRLSNGCPEQERQPVSAHRRCYGQCRAGCSTTMPSSSCAHRVHGVRGFWETF